MRYSLGFLLGLSLLATVAGCGDDKKDPATPPTTPLASGNNPGTGPSGGNGGTSPFAPLAPTGPVTCSGVYHFQNGAQFQNITLFANGTCEIANNAGQVESTATCAQHQDGGTLTLTSHGVSVDWTIAADCLSLSPGAGVVYFRQ